MIMIKIQAKQTRKINIDFAKEIYSQGEWLTHCAVETEKYDIDSFTVRYKKRVYFLVVVNELIEECVEL